jgi:hypothetical protein
VRSLAWGALLAAGATAGLLALEPDQDWTPLFDGRTLGGWTAKITGSDAGVNFGDTFRVEGGLLKVRYDQYGPEFRGRFGHLFYKDAFAFYRLRVEYRFTGTQAPGGPGWAVRNSGVMVHGERPDTMTKDQEFPASIEVQFLGGDGLAARPTSNVCTPGTHIVMAGQLITRHCTNARSATYHGDRWVTSEVEVCGDRSIRHMLDGEVVLAYEAPQLDPSDRHAALLADRAGTVRLARGTIALQSESHPIDFRRVEIRVLDEATCGGYRP